MGRNETSNEFVAWIKALEGVRGVVVNSPSLMAWNSNKTYLLDLQKRGAPLPPTRLVKQDPASIVAAMHELAQKADVGHPLAAVGEVGDGPQGEAGAEDVRGERGRRAARPLDERAPPVEVEAVHHAARRAGVSERGFQAAHERDRDNKHKNKIHHKNKQHKTRITSQQTKTNQQ